MRLINIFSFIIVSLLLVGNAYSAEDVVFQNRLLTIPSINTPDQVGQFQDAQFELTEQNIWRLLNVKEIGTQELGLSGTVDKVELIKTDSFPVQILLRVTGYFSNGCPSVGRINHRLENKHFNIVINSI